MGCPELGQTQSAHILYEILDFMRIWTGFRNNVQNEPHSIFLDTFPFIE
jgi:hypothetical protein